MVTVVFDGVFCYAGSLDRSVFFVVTVVFDGVFCFAGCLDRSGSGMSNVHLIPPGCSAESKAFSQSLSL